MRWVVSAGGPLVVIPRELARSWRGIERRPGDAVTDYDRACAVDDYLGVLEVGPGHGLVLGDEPMQTAFIPSAEGGVLVRWGCAASEDAVLRAVGAVEESSWSPTVHRLPVGTDGAIMFDSAYPGGDVPAALRQGEHPAALAVPLAAGSYRVETADYRPDDETCLILHRLTRMAP
jgi:hypothetical protein